MKVLMNAESFGFGPAAAIAAIFSQIKNNTLITQLDYIGDGHTLDLQKNLPYDNIINSTNKKHFDIIVKDYDVFITALDFERAHWAQLAGTPTIIYDTLLWYWRKIPPSLLNCHTYIVQNFYGVQERIQKLNITNLILVPPLISSKKLLNQLNKDIILFNFGGLENPHWNTDITFKYITNCLDLLIPILEKQNKEIKIVCSKNHIEKFVDNFGNPYYLGYKIENFSYEEMQHCLQKTSLLLATPGLGNIYECANYQIPSVFLPPANDSQGQQLNILTDKGFVNSCLSWDHLVNINVNYSHRQLEVLHDIANCIDSLPFHANKNMAEDIIQKAIDLQGNLKLKELIEIFGANDIKGLDLLENAIIATLKRINSEKK